jgi:TPR repeat protein
MPSTHHVNSGMDDKFATATSRTVRIAAENGDLAAQTEFARRLGRRKRHEDALRWFRLAARSGDPDRQMELGIVLFWDHAAYREGIKWIRRAAEQNHVGAQYFLGAEFAAGDNIRRNRKAAVRWYRSAAKQGHGEAQYNLALMYWAGEGVRKNVAAAHQWLENAGKSGDLLALRALVEGHDFGRLGYRKNHVRAHYWRRRYEKARRIAIESSQIDSAS